MVMAILRLREAVGVLRRVWLTTCSKHAHKLLESLEIADSYPGRWSADATEV